MDEMDCYRTEEDGLIVKLIWTNWEISPNTRKSLKNEIVQKFCGKLVIDHRRESGGVLVMNDVVCQLKEYTNMDHFKATLADSHVRGLRHRSATWKTPSQLILGRNDKPKITVSFYEDHKKFMAQAHPDGIESFIQTYELAISQDDNVTVASDDGVTAESDEEEVADSQVTVNVVSPTKTSGAVSFSEFDLTSPLPRPDITSDLGNLGNLEVDLGEASDFIPKSAFTDYQQNVSKALLELKEEVKTAIREIGQVKVCEVAIKALEIGFDRFRADLSHRMLLCEEEMKNFNSKLNDAHKNIRIERGQRENLSKELIKRQDVIGTPSEDLKLLQQKVDLLAQQITVCCKDNKELKTKLDKLECEAANAVENSPVAINSADLSSTNLQRVPPRPVTPVRERQGIADFFADPPRSEKALGARFDSDVIVFADSNLKKLNPDIFHHTKSTHIELSYTVKNALSTVKNATFTKQPTHILIHLGTNCVERETPSQIAHDMKDLVDRLQYKCPNAIIAISSVPVRSNMMRRVQKLNELYYDLAWEMYAEFIDNDLNINEQKLYDSKHLTWGGFFLLLSNIRYGLFGIKPKLRL